MNKYAKQTYEQSGYFYEPDMGEKSKGRIQATKG